MTIACPAVAQDRVEHPGVIKRMTIMNTAKAAITPLADMMGGRVMFDDSRARSLRRTLIRAMREIPRRFHKSHDDPLSNARPDIWTNWETFRLRAKSARHAATNLRVGNLNRLRQTLPDMIQACLACHDTFRKPP